MSRSHNLWVEVDKRKEICGTRSIEPTVKLITNGPKNANLDISHFASY